MLKVSNKTQVFKFLTLPLIFAAIISVIAIIVNSLLFTKVFLLVLYISLMVVPLIYGIKPFIRKPEKLFRKTGYGELVLEYETLKKILYFILPLMIFWAITAQLMQNDKYINSDDSIHNIFLACAFFGSVFQYVTYGALLRFIGLTKKDFSFYIAKGCCKIISEEKVELEKMKYLQLLLGSYNRYLKRKLKVGINNIDRIYSTIMVKGVEERNQIISLLCKTLEGDRLNLAKFLLTIHKIPDSEFYIKESYLQQLKPVGTALATAITIIISFLGLLHP